MRWRQINHQPRSYVLIFNTGDELSQGLKEFAAEQNLADASFKAIGALSNCKRTISTLREVNVSQNTHCRTRRLPRGFTD